MHFSIWQSTDGQYYREAVGDDNETMAVSETYTTKTSAKHAIEVVQAEAASAKVFDITENRYDRDLP